MRRPRIHFSNRYSMNRDRDKIWRKGLYTPVGRRGELIAFLGSVLLLLALFLAIRTCNRPHTSHPTPAQVSFSSPPRSYFACNSNWDASADLDTASEGLPSREL
jgi:hypothetical protein